MVDGSANLHRSARLGVWEKLLALVQGKGLKLGMTFLDGTNIRAHQKADGADRKGDLRTCELIVKRLAVSWRLWNQGLRDC